MQTFELTIYYSFIQYFFIQYAYCTGPFVNRKWGLGVHACSGMQVCIYLMQRITNHLLNYYYYSY